MKLSSALLPAMVLCPAMLAAQNQQQKPNIVLFFVDDFGYNDLGFRNSSFMTPNIDYFAKNNINFTAAYVPSPTSSPSRAGLLTGQYPIRAGLIRHISEYPKDIHNGSHYELWDQDPGAKYNIKELTLDKRTFASALKEYGYTTYHVGKWHLGRAAYYPNKHGFDSMVGQSDLGGVYSFFPPYYENKEHDSTGKYLTDMLTEEAVSVIEKHNYQKSPLLLYLAHYATHAPYVAKEAMVEKYKAKGLNNQYAIYHAMVESMDSSFGAVIESLKDKGVYDNTIVVFVSDQGGNFDNSPLKGGKNDWPLHEGGARVPLFIHYGGGVAPREVNERVSTMDLYPTFMELASHKAYHQKEIDGISLLPTLLGGRPKERPLFAYRSYDNQFASVIHRDMKYIITRDGNDIMYDLINDPKETTNLRGNAQYAAKEKVLKKLIDGFLKKYETMLYTQ
ncbi:MAG: sulfatase-like hydrolase/transferase [Mucinivorans sp.]